MDRISTALTEMAWKSRFQRQPLQRAGSQPNTLAVTPMEVRREFSVTVHD